MSFGAEDARGEGAQLARKILLSEPSVRPGGDVPDDHPGRHLYGRWKISTGRSGEDLDLGACGSHPFGELNDIDVHATGVAGAWLIEGRGVDGEHGNPARHVAAYGQHCHSTTSGP